MSLSTLKRLIYTLICGLAAGLALASAQVVESQEVSLSMAAFSGDCALCDSTASVEGSAPVGESALPVDLSLWRRFTEPYGTGELTLNGNGSAGPAADWLTNAPTLFSAGPTESQNSWNSYLANGPSFLAGLSWPSPVAPFQYAQDYVGYNPFLGTLNYNTSQATSAFYSALGNPYSFYTPMVAGW